MNIKPFNNYLPDKYSKYADKEFIKEDQPIISFPIDITDIPKETKTLALSLIDYDATPVAGFPWIHWLVGNIPVTNHIPENFSRTDNYSTHGKNSFDSSLIGNIDSDITNYYAGPTPPDKDHNYTLTIYALDTKLDLTNGFYLNELRNKIKNHILATAKIEIKARK